MLGPFIVLGVLRTAGYGGVKLQEYDSEVSYVAFQPEQIKPVTPTLDLKSLNLSSPNLDQALEHTPSEYQDSLTQSR